MMLLGREPEAAYRLLVDRRTFDSAVQRLRAGGQVPQTALNALRLKLSRTGRRAAEVPVSTREIPEGSSVVLRTARGAARRGVLVAQGPREMQIRIAATAEPAAGTALTIYYFSPAGIFTARTRVTRRSGGTAYLAHSSTVTRHQRRRYSRAAVRLPCLATSAESAGHMRSCLVLDLGGGGAALELAGAVIQPGDLLQVSVPGLRASPLTARVLRISRRGTASPAVVGTRFEALSEADRDQIMSFVLRRTGRPPVGRSTISTAADGAAG